MKELVCGRDVMLGLYDDPPTIKDYNSICGFGSSLGFLGLHEGDTCPHCGRFILIEHELEDLEDVEE